MTNDGTKIITLTLQVAGLAKRLCIEIVQDADGKFQASEYVILTKPRVNPNEYRELRKDGQ